MSGSFSFHSDLFEPCEAEELQLFANSSSNIPLLFFVFPVVVKRSECAIEEILDE